MALTSPTLLALRQMAFGDLQGAPPFGQYTAAPPSTEPPGGGASPPTNPYPIPPWASNLPPSTQAALPPGTLGPNVPPPWSGTGAPQPPPAPPAGSGSPLSPFQQLRGALNYAPVNPTSPDIPSDRPGGTHTLSGPGGVQVNYNDRPDSQRIADYFGLQMNESSSLPGPVGNVSMPMYTGRNTDSNLAYEVDIPTAQIEHWIARGDTERDIRMRLGLPV